MSPLEWALHKFTTTGVGPKLDWSLIKRVNGKVMRLHSGGPPIKKSKPPKINPPFPPSGYTRSDQISSIIKDEPTMRLNRYIYINMWIFLIYMINITMGLKHLARSGTRGWQLFWAVHILNRWAGPRVMNLWWVQAQEYPDSFQRRKHCLLGSLGRWRKEGKKRREEEREEEEEKEEGRNERKRKKERRGKKQQQHAVGALAPLSHLVAQLMKIR